MRGCSVHRQPRGKGEPSVKLERFRDVGTGVWQPALRAKLNTVLNRTGGVHTCAAVPEGESGTVLKRGCETLPTIGDVGQTSEGRFPVSSLWGSLVASL